jgi:hypothetical protein
MVMYVKLEIPVYDEGSKSSFRKKFNARLSTISSEMDTLRCKDCRKSSFQTTDYYMYRGPDLGDILVSRNDEFKVVFGDEDIFEISIGPQSQIMKDYAGFLFDPENPKIMKIHFNTVDGIILENFCNMEDHVWRWAYTFGTEDWSIGGRVDNKQNSHSQSPLVSKGSLIERKFSSTDHRQNWCYFRVSFTNFDDWRIYLSADKYQLLDSALKANEKCTTMTDIVICDLS